MNTDAKRAWIIVMCFYMNTQTGSEWSQGLLLPMTVMLTTGAFIKSAVPGREKEGEKKDGCEYGASRDGCKMKDGREEANTLLRVDLGQRTNKEDKIDICFEHKEDVSTNPPFICALLSEIQTDILQ